MLDILIRISPDNILKFFKNNNKIVNKDSVPIHRVTRKSFNEEIVNINHEQNISLSFLILYVQLIWSVSFWG